MKGLIIEGRGSILPTHRHRPSKYRQMTFQDQMIIDRIAFNMHDKAYENGATSDEAMATELRYRASLTSDSNMSPETK